MSYNISHPPFSHPLFTQLVRRLRYANARYDQIAYQCRRSRRPTYHAKRRACRVGLHIDTSRTRVAWPDDELDPTVSVSAVSTRTLSVEDTTAESPAWVATEIETEAWAGEERSVWSADSEISLPNPWPEPDVVRKQSATCLSPLELGLRNVDELDLAFQSPVPGAPRWRTKPLPDDELGYDRGTGRKTNELSPRVACTYKPAWGDVIHARVSVSVSNKTYGDLDVTVPQRRLKRKPQDDMDRAMFSRRTGFGVMDIGLSGIWWSQT